MDQSQGGESARRHHRVPKFLKFTVRLASNISESELNELKYMCRDKIPKKKLENIVECYKLFDFLFEQQELEENDLGLLVELFGTIGRNDLIAEINKYQNENGDNINDESAQVPLSSGRPVRADLGRLPTDTGTSRVMPSMASEGQIGHTTGAPRPSVLTSHLLGTQATETGDPPISWNFRPKTSTPAPVEMPMEAEEGETEVKKLLDPEKPHWATWGSQSRPSHPAGSRIPPRLPPGLAPPQLSGAENLLTDGAASISLMRGNATNKWSTDQVQQDGVQTPMKSTERSQSRAYPDLDFPNPSHDDELSDNETSLTQLKAAQSSSPSEAVEDPGQSTSEMYPGTAIKSIEGSGVLRADRSGSHAGPSPRDESSITVPKHVVGPAFLSQDAPVTVEDQERVVRERRERANTSMTQLKHQQSITPKARGKVKELYRYQFELAEEGVQGKNCIICAPTGSGKTITAGYICQERMAAVRGPGGHKFNALFIVCIRNLVQQQCSALTEIMDDDDVTGMTGDTTLRELMGTSNVIVLTAQIFVNALEAGEVKMTDFDLLIMDECHHTNLDHPYNVIMKKYHGARREEPGACREEPGASLPQVVGLTASLGVGTDKDNALDHYIELCANLDSEVITHVRDERNKDELIKHNPHPQKDQIITVYPRDANDMMLLLISNLMAKVEQRTNLGRSCPERGSQHYENWVVRLRKEAEQKPNRDVIFGCQVLQKLNTALASYDELQAREVIVPLIEFFQDPAIACTQYPFEQAIRDQFDDLYPDMVILAEAECVSDNPKLQQLGQLLIDLFHATPDSRGILLTRTRFSVDGLLKFIERQQDLKGLVLPAKFVGQGGESDQMTDKEQDQTLKRFRAAESEPNRVNLLVATDVAQEGLDMPRCNFVIRYNFVSNEIGTVQSRGRARAKLSECYLLVNKGSINERREYNNLEKEYLMMAALDDIDQIEPQKLKEYIRTKQKELWQVHVAQQERSRRAASLVAPVNITIHCKHCKKLLCPATCMRKRGSNFIVDGPEFLDRVTIRRKATPLDFRYDAHVGFSACIECSQQLGPQIKYKQGTRPMGHALSKDKVMWRHTDFPELFNPINKWSKVPFSITEENICA